METPAYRGEMSVEVAGGVRVLGHALDQAGDLLDHVHEDDLEAPTPCRDWNVAQLVDHLVAVPANFLDSMRGQEVDWSATPPRLTSGWAAEFRIRADDLIHAWHQMEAEGAHPSTPPEWQVAELALHTWDLARGLGRPTDGLDLEVAETGLTFMKAALKPEMRGDAFGPEQPAPADAGPYEALAAFAGRTV